MRRRGTLRGELFASTALAVSLASGCASSGSSHASAAAAQASRPPSAEQLAQDRAASEFELGRDAALAGDFECARGHFQGAVDAVRPAGGPPVTGPMLAFSLDLYESIQRYEALAGAT